MDSVRPRSHADLTNRLWRLMRWTTAVGAAAAFLVPAVPGRPWTGILLVGVWVGLVSALLPADGDPSSVSLRASVTAAATTSAVLAVVVLAATWSGGLFFESREDRGASQEQLDATWDQMDRCWGQVIAAAPAVDAIDTASPEALNAVTRITLLTCMDKQTPAGFTCDSYGCFDEAHQGYYWNRVIERWVERCWGEPVGTPSC